MKNPKRNNIKNKSIKDSRKIVEAKFSTLPKMPSGLSHGEWTTQAVKVLNERYLKKDKDGIPLENPDEMCWRVAWEMASAEIIWGKTKSEVDKTAQTYYKLLVSRKFLPNSPTLMNAGTKNYLQYSGCYVLPVGDSLVEIFDAIKQQAIIHQSGGGTGFSFSRLRPRGSIVKSTSGVASGPISFMKIFDAATNEVKQGGNRRGANMGILRVDHPDVIEFIHCKEKGGITNFNISVAITDEFMQAYQKGGDYDLIDPRTKESAGKLSARTVFDEIADGAWRTGDPGIVFVDRLNRGTANPVPKLGPIESTNPCGEQPLYPHDSCNLGSIFLTYFVKEDKGIKKVDWQELKKVTDLAIRFMDSVIEMNPYPLEEVKKTTLAIRRIGLGVGGWADMLVDLGIAYDSEEALTLGGKVMKTIQDQATKTSIELAKERGAFPMFKESVYKKGSPRRNATVTTIAPTGSISIIAGTSSGIEPLFAIAYQHVVKDESLDRTLTFMNPKFVEVCEERGIWNEDLENSVSAKGHVRDLDNLPEDIKKIFGTAHEIDYDWHIKHQAVFQKYTQNAVSKTINMVRDVSREDIKRAYLLAWETNCKGVTVFRDGCKDAQVLNMGVKDETKKLENGVSQAIVRPFKAKGATYKLNTPVGSAFITINEDENGEPLELFLNVGKAGSDVTAMAEALGRTVSIALRFRGDLRPRERANEIALQLAGIGGRRSVGFGANKILSLPDAVAAALSNHFGFKVNGFSKENNSSVQKEEENHTSENGVTNGNGHEFRTHLDSASANVLAASSINLEGINDHTSALAESNWALNANEDLFSSQMKDICPACGASALVYEEGCSKCHICGHSEC